ncbi:ABC transporter permease [Atopococcus tabaci]|uniref:ABC transporter permease n=1 Tax=Atopococcus tabaci TaxID=269774 RepID=UPI00040896F9|nr:ABC transporter permease [Atopococcus tabaci]
MNKYWIILKEVYKKNVKSIGFVTMVLSPIILLGIVALIIYFVGRSETNQEPTSIAVLTEDSAVQEIMASPDIPLEVNADIASVEEAEEAMTEEKLDGYLVLETADDQIQGEYIHTEGNATETVAILNQVLSTYQVQIKGAAVGLTPEEVMDLVAPVEVQTTTVRIDEGEISQEDSLAETIQNWSAYAVSIGIFIFIMTYAGIIAEEVASEKGTRIMEVILSSVSSTAHFFGKLSGVLLICLTQIAIYVVLALVAYPFIRDIEWVQQLLEGVDLAAIFQSLLGYTLIFFLLGVIMYVVLAAFFGSLVTKIEDVNKSVTPIVFLAMIGFYGGLFAFASPDQPVVEVLSYVPFFTPFIMPFRIAANTVTTTGVWLSILGSTVFAVLLTYLSLMMYRSNVLIYSDTNMFQTIKRSWKVMQSDRKARTT